MSKLQIQRLRDAGPDGWHMRFSGERDDFMELVSDLKYEGCRWDREALGGRGAWVIEHSTLLLFNDRFTNLQQCLEREQRRRELASPEHQTANKARIAQEDVEDVPF